MLMLNLCFTLEIFIHASNMCPYNFKNLVLSENLA